MGLREDILCEPVSVLKITPGVIVPSNATVRQAVDLMRQREEGCVIVVDDRGVPEGMFTEHQLAGLLINRPGFFGEPIASHMKSSWARMSLRDPIATLVHRLQGYGLRYVIVVDDEGRATGVVGQRALMHYIADNFPRQVRAQKMEAKVSMDAREGAGLRNDSENPWRTASSATR